MADFDWTGFTDAVVAGVTDAARTMLGEASGETPYALALSGFYAEATSVIELPFLALGTEQALPDADCRFSPADWERQDFDWFATEPVAGWADRLQQKVEGLALAAWEEAHRHFEEALLTALDRVRASLVDEGALASSVVCFLDDEEQVLLQRSVTTRPMTIGWQRRWPASARAASCWTVTICPRGRW